MLQKISSISQSWGPANLFCSEQQQVRAAVKKCLRGTVDMCYWHGQIVVKQIVKLLIIYVAIQGHHQVLAEICCFDTDFNFQEYTSFISYELCYWLPSHIDIFTYTTGMTFLKVKLLIVVIIHKNFNKRSLHCLLDKRCILRIMQHWSAFVQPLLQWRSRRY